MCWVGERIQELNDQRFRWHESRHESRHEGGWSWEGWICWGECITCASHLFYLGWSCISNTVFEATVKRTKKGHAHVRPYMSVTNSVGVVRVGVGVGIIMKLSIEHDEYPQTKKTRRAQGPCFAAITARRIVYPMDRKFVPTGFKLRLRGCHRKLPTNWSSNLSQISTDKKGFQNLRESWHPGYMNKPKK